MKKYIAPACEMMNLAIESNILLTSIQVDSTDTDTQLSGRMDDYDTDWDE